MTEISREDRERIATAIAASATPPSSEELANAPLIEGWAPVLAMLRPCLMGRVLFHPDYEDGADIQTSPILAFDAQAGYAHSTSRWYRLGASVYEDDPVLVRHMQAKASPFLSLAEPAAFAEAVSEEHLRAQSFIRKYLDA